jgi:hypothetical protein
MAARDADFADSEQPGKVVGIKLNDAGVAVNVVENTRRHRRFDDPEGRSDDDDGGEGGGGGDGDEGGGGGGGGGGASSSTCPYFFDAPVQPRDRDYPKAVMYTLNVNTTDYHVDEFVAFVEKDPFNPKVGDTIEVSAASITARSGLSWRTGKVEGISDDGLLVVAFGKPPMTMVERVDRRITRKPYRRPWSTHRRRILPPLPKRTEYKPGDEIIVDYEGALYPAVIAPKTSDVDRDYDSDGEQRVFTVFYTEDKSYEKDVPETRIVHKLAPGERHAPRYIQDDDDGPSTTTAKAAAGKGGGGGRGGSGAGADGGGAGNDEDNGGDFFGAGEGDEEEGGSARKSKKRTAASISAPASKSHKKKARTSSGAPAAVTGAAAAAAVDGD